MKANLVAQVAIAAKPTAIFNYLTDLKYHHLWNPHLLSISPQISLKRGVSYQTTSLLLGVKVSGKNAVTKFTSNRELEIQNNTGALQYQVNYKLLSGEDHKTLVSCTTSIASKSEAFAFASPVLKLLARRELQADLQALKIAVEQHLE